MFINVLIKILAMVGLGALLEKFSKSDNDKKKKGKGDDDDETGQKGSVQKSE